MIDRHNATINDPPSDYQVWEAHIYLTLRGEARFYLSALRRVSIFFGPIYSGVEKQRLGKMNEEYDVIVLGTGLTVSNTDYSDGLIFKGFNHLQAVLVPYNITPNGPNHHYVNELVNGSR